MLQSVCFYKLRSPKRSVPEQPLQLQSHPINDSSADLAKSAQFRLKLAQSASPILRPKPRRTDLPDLQLDQKQSLHESDPDHFAASPSRFPDDTAPRLHDGCSRSEAVGLARRSLFPAT